jgi:hypothetical protein
MNIAAESEENQKNIGSVRLFLIQNVGLLTGFGVILIMAVYGGDINFEKFFICCCQHHERKRSAFIYF